jgi:ketosteroid isomerase-like protein
MNRRRFDEMWELFATDAVWSGGGNPPARVAPIAKMKETIVDPMPIFVTGGIDFTLHAMTAEGDRVAAEVSSHAELTTGAVYANQYHMLFVFRDGEIVEVKEYNDTLHAREVFGSL